MKMKVYESIDSRARCPLCGRTVESKRLARLTDETEGTLVDTICERCIEAGPQDTARKMEHQARWLRRQARTLEWLAAEVESIDNEGWPTQAP
jgi:hypothetical protein